MSNPVIGRASQVDEVVQVGVHPRHPELTMVMLWAKGEAVGERAWIAACALGDSFVHHGGLDTPARALIVDMRPGGEGVRVARAVKLRDAHP